METEKMAIDGKIGQLYYSRCPNCTKFIVYTKGETITCPKCRKKYNVEYPEESK